MFSPGFVTPEWVKYRDLFEKSPNLLPGFRDNFYCGGEQQLCA